MFLETRSEEETLSANLMSLMKKKILGRILQTQFLKLIPYKCQILIPSINPYISPSGPRNFWM